MKKQFLLLLFLYIPIVAFCQDTGKDPYTIFGHKSGTKYETRTNELLIVKNINKSSTTKAVAFDIENGYVLFLDINQSIISKLKVDPRLILRFISTDPAGKEYPSLSPYVYVANTPLNATDPDGQRIIFINGYYQNNWFGENFIGSNLAGAGYWAFADERVEGKTLNSNFVRGAQNFFKDYTKITESNFIDGSGSWNSSGADRYQAGYDYAEANIKTLTADMVEGETFKLVSHSQGGAYSAGIAEYLVQHGYKVESSVYLSPHQTQGFKNPSSVNAIQLGYNYDPVSTGSDKVIDGVNKMGTVDKDASEMMYNHGSTKVGFTVWKQVTDLRDISFRQIALPGYLYTGPLDTYSPSTTRYGTDFSKVNVNGEWYRKTSHSTHAFEITTILRPVKLIRMKKLFSYITFMVIPFIAFALDYSVNWILYPHGFLYFQIYFLPLLYLIHLILFTLFVWKFKSTFEKKFSFVFFITLAIHFSIIFSIRFLLT